MSQRGTAGYGEARVSQENLTESSVGTTYVPGNPYYIYIYIQYYVPLKYIEYGVYGNLIQKPHSIYLRWTACVAPEKS